MCYNIIKGELNYMKKFFCILFFSLIISTCFAEEFKGFLEIPFGTTKAATRSAMENKGWSFLSSYSDYSNYVFSGKKYAGKDILAIFLTFKGNNFFSATVMFTGDDAQEILNAMIKKYELKKVEGEDYYSTSSKSALFTIIDGALSIIDGTQFEESTIESDI